MSKHLIVPAIFSILSISTAFANTNINYNDSILIEDNAVYYSDVKKSDDGFYFKESAITSHKEALYSRFIRCVVLVLKDVQCLKDTTHMINIDGEVVKFKAWLQDKGLTHTEFIVDDLLKLSEYDKNVILFATGTQFTLPPIFVSKYLALINVHIYNQPAPSQYSNWNYVTNSASKNTLESIFGNKKTKNINKVEIDENTVLNGSTATGNFNIKINGETITIKYNDKNIWRHFYKNEEHKSKFKTFQERGRNLMSCAMLTIKANNGRMIRDVWNTYATLSTIVDMDSDERQQFIELIYKEKYLLYAYFLGLPEGNMLPTTKCMSRWEFR